MKAKSLFLLAIITITCTSMMCECDDKTSYEPQLPPETTTGANTFGCLVNGKVWRNGGVGFPHYSLSVFNSDSSLEIAAISNISKTYEIISLHIKRNLISNKVFIIDSLDIYINFDRTVNDNINCLYEKIGKGRIELTKSDFINGIFSGRFEATLYNSECDSIVITQGRFDLKK